MTTLLHIIAGSLEGADFVSAEQQEAWCATVSQGVLQAMRGDAYADYRKNFPLFEISEVTSKEANEIWTHKFVDWWEALPPIVARNLYRETVQ